ncbi:MAG: 3-phosphoshikimate 1-carboxyvinyltransferase [Lachnospiraceae bacterium]|nr:3-phosphoshikimate 1-carboxyvinyltransferase [Lachnospiraceae bacterium]
MIARIHAGKASGTVSAPPSKSMAHRLLLAAGLSEGESRIRNLAGSEDILATADCLRALGKTVLLKDGEAVLSGPGVPGSDHESTGIPDKPVLLPVRESGSTLRFLIPIALTLGREVRFTGTKRLFERPLSVYEDLARKEGFLFERDEDSLLVKGNLRAGSYLIPGWISSQFVSGMLFALPNLLGDSRIELLPPVESRPYIDMTMQALHLFGIETGWSGELTIEIPGGQKSRAQEYAVEGDYSNAAFLEVLNVLGGTVRIEGLDPLSLQGDRIYAEHFKAIQKGFAEIDISDCPDLGPVLFAAAAAMHGGRFTGTGRLRLKESDRCQAMQEELLKFGIRCENDADSFTVCPGELRAPSQRLYGHNDHRIVMALSSLCTLCGGEIEGAEAVRKSWPEYFDTLKKLGIEVEQYAVDQ